MDKNKAITIIKNNLHTIKKYGINKILTYCGLDAIYENMLGQKQRIKLGFEEV